MISFIEAPTTKPKKSKKGKLADNSNNSKPKNNKEKAARIPPAQAEAAAPQQQSCSVPCLMTLPDLYAHLKSERNLTFTTQRGMQFCFVIKLKSVSNLRLTNAFAMLFRYNSVK